MSTHANNVANAVSGTPGTGTITLGSAVTGSQSFSAAYGANATVDVFITDGTAWEVARACTYTHSGTTLTRGTLEASSTGSAISLTSAAVVRVAMPASTGNAVENLLGAWGALGGENSITTTATAVIGRLNVCSGTTADYTVTLPAVSGNSGKYIGFAMAPGLTKLVTLDGNASETIDGATTRVMWANESALLYCNGTAWVKVAGKSIPMIGAIKRTSNQTSFPSGSSAKIQANVSHIDNTGLMVDTSGQRLVCARGGIYVLSGQVVFCGTAGADMPADVIIQCHLYVNSSLSIYSKASLPAAEYPSVYAQSIYSVTAGHAIELYGAQNSGSSKEVSATSTYLDTYVLANEVVQW